MGKSHILVISILKMKTMVWSFIRNWTFTSYHPIPFATVYKYIVI